MITIYQKTKEELAKDRGPLSEEETIFICPTYVIINGEKVDTSALTEDQMITLIEDDISDYINPKGSYKFPKGQLNSLDLIKAAKFGWRPSIDIIIQMCRLKQIYGKIVDELINAMDKDIMSKAIATCQAQKEANGISTSPTEEEIIDVLTEMSNNEKLQNQNGIAR